MYSEESFELEEDCKTLNSLVDSEGNYGLVMEGRNKQTSRAKGMMLGMDTKLELI